MLDLLLIPLLAAHLLCMNVASAAPVVCCWLEWKAKRGDALADSTAQYLGEASWRLLLIGAVLGACYGAMQWNADYQHLWTHILRYKAQMAIGEYLFSLGLLLLYAKLPRPAKMGTGGRSGRMLLAFLAGTNLLYHFPFLFSVASSLQAEAPLDAPLNVSGFRQAMLRPDVLARVVHIVLASFAVTSLMLFGFAMRLQKEASPPPDMERLARWGGWLGLIPSLAQMLVGLWLVAALPPAWQQRLLGEDWLATIMLGISVLATFTLLQDFAALALGEFQAPLMRRSMLLMVVIVVLMTGTLKRIHPPVSSTVVSQISEPSSVPAGDQP